MPLAQYSKKRKFSQTPEPKPKIKKLKSKKLIFVVHFHRASHDHFDLRLEMNRVLKSWAIPKQPATTKETKRLAIQVEDHPIEYANFEGIIPEGNYGAGKVKIWDKGNYELIKKTPREIEFNLHGKKLNGKFVLIKTQYGNKPGKSWLFFKL